MNTTVRRIALSCVVSLSVTVASFGQTGRSLGNYTYDASGNVESIGPDTDGLTNFYDYDSAGRLIQFFRKNAAGTTVSTETFEYDAYGNQTKQTTNGTVTTLPATASTNRLTGATYDATGNMIAYGAESYVFDPVGTMTTKSGSWGSAFYVYTADDERVGIEGSDGSWRYMGRDLDGKVLREWSATSGTATNWAWVEDYVYRDGMLAAAIRPTSQGGVRHFHLDHLGTPRLITSSGAALYAAHDYDPYGREITSPTQELALGHDTPEPMKFTGHERDFAGSYTAPVLDYMHARYYNPQAGRFLSVDPGQDWDVDQPQSWNMYTYVRNHPLNSNDPTGRCEQKEGAPPCTDMEITVSALEPDPEPPPVDVFVFGAITPTTNGPVKAAGEVVALFGYNSNDGFYTGHITATGVEIGGEQNYVGVFNGVEETTISPAPEEIDLQEVGFGAEIPFVAGAGGGIGGYQTHKDAGVFGYAAGGILGQDVSAGAGFSMKPFTAKAEKYLRKQFAALMLTLKKRAYGGH
jgi:RHS repeat-associated protein